MERDTEKTAAPIELGTASRRTLGGDGAFIDFVRMMAHWGIAAA